MTIIYRQYIQGGLQGVADVPVATVRIVGDKDIELFKQLVQRATNVWDTAPPQIKEFADMVIHGKLLQDYQAQAQAMFGAKKASEL